MLRAARSQAWTEPRTRRLLVELETALRRGARPARLAVLTRETSPDWEAVVRAVFPRARVVRVPPGTSRSTAHARLAAFGRYHAILDDTLDGADGIPALQDVFLHLRPGGVLLVRRPPSDPGEAWQALSEQVRARSGEPDPGKDQGYRWRALPNAVGSVAVRRGHVAMTNRRAALVKLREHELDIVLAERGDAETEALRLPAREFTSRCTLRENTEVRDPLMPETMSVPPMSLRVYEDVLCVPRQIAVKGNLVLPDSFRFNGAPQLKNHFLSSLGPHFAPVPAGGKRARRLEGTYFYLDSEWTRHFGHAVTEQLSRLWAVPEARTLYPDLKALLDRRNRRAGVASYEVDIFGAAGFCESDIVLHHRPVRVERLVAASPMWALPTHVHPDIAELWRTVGERIASRAPEASYPRRIFASRRRARRGCKNLEQVEALFASHDFEVFYPEDLPFPTQVRMFREAEVIAGFAGSGMFNMQFCQTPRHVIALGPTSYPSRNEYMISAAAGHRLDHVWSEPDPEEVRGPQPRYAGFTFDFANEGAFLRDILENL
jgi:capsular polysaccharide biosynthesis protein